VAENMHPEDVKRYLLGRISHRRSAWLREYLRELALSYAEREREIKVLGPECDSDEGRLELFLGRTSPVAGIQSR
jgi:hypothetical protein